MLRPGLNSNASRTPFKVMLGLAFSLLAMFSSFSYAALATATVSKNVVGVNEVFQLQISIDDNVNTNALDLSVLDDDFNYGTPSISSGTSFVNGVVTRQTEWKVAIATKAVGTFTIPSFKIGSSRTEPITITSMKSASDGNTASAQPDIHISANVDKEALYLGETIRYTVRIRIGEQMSQASLIAPSGDGLDVRQIGDDHQVETVLNGRRYLIITRNYQITANKPGDILLRGAAFKGSIIKGSRGFGSTLRVPVEKQGEDFSIAVKDKPSDYQGLWLPTEDLQLEQNWQPESATVKVGEPLTRTITLRIKNAEQSRLPNLNLQYPGSVRVYDEKPVYGTDANYTTMTLKQVIIPRESGELTLPSLAINWWNTVEGKQQTSRIDGLTLHVVPGEGSSPVNLSGAMSQTVTQTGTQTSGQPTNPADTSMVTSPSDASANTTAEFGSTTQSDWWPWVALGFATLWLFTVKLWLNARRQLRTLMKQPEMPAGLTTYADSVDGMMAAVKRNDAIQLQTFFQQWKKYNPTHPQREELSALVANIMAQRFARESPESSQVNTEKLLTILNNLRATPSEEEAKSRSHLAPIVP